MRKIPDKIRDFFNIAGVLAASFIAIIALGYISGDYKPVELPYVYACKYGSGSKCYHVRAELVYSESLRKNWFSKVKVYETTLHWPNGGTSSLYCREYKTEKYYECAEGDNWDAWKLEFAD